MLSRILIVAIAAIFASSSLVLAADNSPIVVAAGEKKPAKSSRENNLDQCKDSSDCSSGEICCKVGMGSACVPEEDCFGTEKKSKKKK